MPTNWVPDDYEIMPGQTGSAPFALNDQTGKMDNEKRPDCYTYKTNSQGGSNGTVHDADYSKKQDKGVQPYEGADVFAFRSGLTRNVYYRGKERDGGRA